MYLQLLELKCEFENMYDNAFKFDHQMQQWTLQILKNVYNQYIVWSSSSGSKSIIQHMYMWSYNWERIEVNQYCS